MAQWVLEGGTFCKRCLRLLVVCGGLSPVGLVAQQAASTPGTGTVTGHVICGDTQRPARFAQVTLFGVPVEVSAAPKVDPGADAAALMAQMKVQLANLSKTSMVQAQTDITGTFTATDVAPGDYYVFAAEPGYVEPTAVIQAALDAGADPHKQLPNVAVVHVAAEHSVNADVTIDRGAAISGTVMWDDGTPVSGAHVAVVPAKGDAKELPPEFMMLAAGGSLARMLAVTDDLGRYRIAGLSAGDYLVQATLPQNTSVNLTGGSFNLAHALSQKPLEVYAPAAFHKADAKAVTLKATDDYRDLQVTVTLSGMHKVSGRVGSAEDHHGLNSATIRLTDATDKEFVRSGFVDAGGNFTVSLVPAGTYDLAISDAGDTEPNKPSKDDSVGLMHFSQTHTVKSYEDGKQSVIVTDSDVAGLVIELTPAKKVKPEVNLEDLMKQ